MVSSLHFIAEAARHQMKKQPKQSPETSLFMARAKPPLSTDFTEWRRRQARIPPIADAVRELIRKGLAADGIPEKKSA
jgi:hypothetical protein